MTYKYLPYCVQFPRKGPSPARPPTSSAKVKQSMDFTEDPFRDYRYEDPFNLEDPFADVADASELPMGKNVKKITAVDPFSMESSIPPKPTNITFSAFESDDFFSSKSSSINNSNSNNNNEAFGGRQSVPLPINDPFNKTGRVSAPITNNAWSTWGAGSGGGGWDTDCENWATGDNWANLPSPAVDANKLNNNTQLNDTPQKSKIYEPWSKIDSKGSDKASKSLQKKEKSPKPMSKYTKTLSQAVSWGSLNKNKKSGANNNTPPIPPPPLPSEEKQLAWAAAESKRLEEKRKEENEQYERELKMAMALSIGNH